MLLISFELVNSDVADLQYCRCFQKRVSFLLPPTDALLCAEPQKSIGGSFSRGQSHQFRAYSGGSFSRGPGAAHFSAPRTVEA
ncbi:hypothetical protein CLOM_g5447 [Closterium sp. NIES-68]|nr:hypothetical protein CLOM_g5447 [Closterium sp. NIES-68]